MIHEFALHPDAVNDPSFKHIVADCGIQHGRLISRFPHEWVKKAIEACKIQDDVKRKTIVEKIVSLRRDQKMVGFNRKYVYGKDWLENAEDQYKIRPFRAIVSPLNPQGCAHVLSPQEIDEKTSLWDVQTQRIVPRKAYDLACCAKTLLSISREILFIDPYFDPLKSRFLNTLSHMISFAYIFKEPRRLELHAEYDYRKELRRETDWQEGCTSNLHSLIPEGSTMEVFRWETRPAGDIPHARYVLTEIGGIDYNYGLDEWESDGQTTNVSLLGPSVYEQRWKEHQKGTAAYHLVDNFPVTGSKKNPAKEA